MIEMRYPYRCANRFAQFQQKEQQGYRISTPRNSHGDAIAWSEHLMAPDGSKKAIGER